MSVRTTVVSEKGRLRNSTNLGHSNPRRDPKGGCVTFLIVQVSVSEIHYCNYATIDDYTTTQLYSHVITDIVSWICILIQLYPT